MRSSFPGYYRPTDAEFEILWKESTFVIDANVLLNLYRYPKKASNELLDVLARVHDRLWIPHQAGLEYQRNRLGVIAEQKKRFVEVRGVVDSAASNLNSEFEKLQIKKRHYLINSDKLIEKITPIFNEFLDELAKLESVQFNVQDEDPIRDRIDTIIGKNIGGPFSQKNLNDIYEEGKLRYQTLTPPGYMDEKKGDEKEPRYGYGGLQYEAKYGDLIFWKQILEYAKEKAISKVILVTDDEKEDWWHTLNSLGRKKIGPRPELVEEARRESEVSSFYMYNSDTFLSFAKKFIAAPVSEESIEQVRDTRIAISTAGGFLSPELRNAELAVFRWIVNTLPEYEITENKTGFPDFTARSQGNVIGYDVLFLRETRFIHPRMRERIYRAYHDISEKGYSKIFIVIVSPSGDFDFLRNQLSRTEIPKGTGIIWGQTPSSDREDGQFVPLGMMEG